MVENGPQNTLTYIVKWSQIEIGLSLYFFCVGLATFKDTFWSSDTNPDHPFYYDCMIGEDVTDPNIPWTVRKKSNVHKIVHTLNRYILRYGVSINIIMPCPSLGPK